MNTKYNRYIQNEIRNSNHAILEDNYINIAYIDGIIKELAVLAGAGTACDLLESDIKTNVSDYIKLLGAYKRKEIDKSTFIREYQNRIDYE